MESPVIMSVFRSATSGAAPQGSQKQNGRAMGPAASSNDFRKTLVLGRGGSRTGGRRRSGGLRCFGRLGCAAFGDLGQRHRAFRLLAQEFNNVGALRIPRQTGEGHGGAGDKATRIGDEMVAVSYTHLRAHETDSYIV